MRPLVAQLLYALAWASFGLGHSLLAAPRVKARLRAYVGPSYRLLYNLVAVLHLALVYSVGRVLFAGGAPYALPPWAAAALWAVQGTGWLVLVAGLAGYDLGRLAGTRQLANHRRGVREPEDEPLRRGGLNRLVRHPLYAGGFLILWGRVDGAFALATAVWGSLYLLVGARLEERKLLALYGEDYAEYRRRVPAFIPWKGRPR